MADQKEIDELVKMLDASVVSGTGHINVKVNENADITLEEVSVQKGMDCSLGDTACQIPNLPQEGEEF